MFSAKLKMPGLPTAIFAVAAMSGFGAFTRAAAQRSDALPSPPQGEITIWAPTEPGGRRIFTPDWKEIGKFPLGARGNPVRVFLARGEADYLQKLSCGNGSRPTDIARIGGSGGSPFGGVLDVYSLTCDTRKLTLYMDMYHPGYVEHRAASGFVFGRAGLAL